MFSNYEGANSWVLECMCGPVTTWQLVQWTPNAGIILAQSSGKIKTTSTQLQADSLPAELQGKPKTNADDGIMWTYRN